MYIIYIIYYNYIYIVPLNYSILIMPWIQAQVSPVNPAIPVTSGWDGIAAPA